MRPPAERTDPAAPRHPTVIRAQQRDAATIGAREGIAVADRAPSYRAHAAAADARFCYVA